MIFFSFCLGMSEPPHQICLRELQPFLIRQLDVSVALNHVIATGCLTEQEVQSIDHVMLTDNEKMARFITILRKKDERAFEALLEGLKENSFDFVINKLEEKLLEIQLNPESYQRIKG